MNVTKPKFLTTEPDESYYLPPDPYKDPPKMNVNLQELLRYADKHGKKPADLTPEEFQMFVL